jgi:WD40 repeat protein
VWDAMNGQVVSVLQQTSLGWGVTSVSFSPDRKRIITTSFGVMQLWDAETGKLVFVFDEDLHIIDARFGGEGTVIHATAFSKALTTKEERCTYLLTYKSLPATPAATLPQTPGFDAGGRVSEKNVTMPEIAPMPREVRK